MAQVPSEIADRLYTAPPELFVSTRDAAVAEARRAGDRQVAAAIAKLRKPSVAAWLVNLLALRRPDRVAALVRLAGQLRTAQRELRGDELRELSAQRRAVVAELVDQAGALAAAERPGLPGAKLPLADVEATLTAALADREVAEQVCSGRLLRTAGYPGFGELPRPRLHLVTGAEPALLAGAEPAPAAGGEAGAGAAEAAGPAGESDAPGRVAGATVPAARTALAEAEVQVARARTDLEEAEAALARATADEQDAARALAEVDAALAELARRRVAVEEELRRCKSAHKAAQRVVTTARRRLGAAQAAQESITGVPADPAGSDQAGLSAGQRPRPNGRGRRSAG